MLHHREGAAHTGDNGRHIKGLLRWEDFVYEQKGGPPIQRLSSAVGQFRVDAPETADVHLDDFGLGG